MKSRIVLMLAIVGLLFFGVSFERLSLLLQS